MPETHIEYQCEYCKQSFKRTLSNANKNIKNITKNVFCSPKCNHNHQKTSIKCKCKNCGKTVYRKPKEYKKSKSGNHFCSSRCSGTYNSTHKTHGTRRSKLEKYIEEQLTKLYPNLEMIFNGKETINSELDIYIPSMKLAFELNGIFHYEPIYGEDKLEKIQNNDERKFQACLKRGIELCIIDTSSQKYFKPKTSKKYLDIITSIINKNYNKLERK